ncbi:MAG TPA: adenylate/guanylate cyclase domain-containing protein [Microvirga sp.]|nr:adenylate/guanylate cyclase domain-containing protein [Microvirga sp.]
MSSETAQLISWLHQQGLSGADGGTILEGLCGRLLGTGLDLERAVVGYLVFHPQFDGITFVWDRAAGKARREAATRPDILRAPSPFLQMQTTKVQELRYRLAEMSAFPFPFLEGLRGRGFTDYLAFFQPFGGAAGRDLWPDLPEGIDMHEGVTGSFATTRGGGFGERELATLRALAPPLSLAVKAGAVLEMAETLLGAYLGTASGRSVLRGQVRRGQGQVIHAVVWHSDMRGSTELAETAPLHSYLATLNSYYDCVVDAVLEHGGEVMKFIGDGVLGLFPFAPGDQAEQETCRRALSASRDALDRLARVNAHRAAAGMSRIRFGIALHAGDVMYGNVGSAQRLDFTIMGRTVNEVVRLETLCKTLDLPLVVSEAVAALQSGPLELVGRHVLPGVGREMAVFSLPELLRSGEAPDP